MIMQKKRKMTEKKRGWEKGEREKEIEGERGKKREGEGKIEKNSYGH